MGIAGVAREHVGLPMIDLAIIGGGLSGLALTAELASTPAFAGYRYQVFEASNRLGGRIYCTKSQTDSLGDRFDLGPTWYWPDQQTCMQEFVQRHQLSVFSQYQSGDLLYLPGRKETPQRFRDPQGYAGAWRIDGGAMGLIKVLARQLPEPCIAMAHKLRKLADKGDHILLTFEHASEEVVVAAKRVVLCVAPRVLATRVEFSPALDHPLMALLHATPTWMAGHAKAIIQYERSFWREAGLSGNAMVHYPGMVLGEIFDACSGDGQAAALGGFLSWPAQLRQQYRNDLEALIIEQLFSLFGPEAASPSQIHIKDWMEEEGVAVAADVDIPLGHPQYGHQWLRLDHWDDKLYFASTETDDQFGGYMEGALRSALRIARSLMLTR